MAGHIMKTILIIVLTCGPALAHQAGNNYHYHAQPIGLRYQLGDHVDYNAATNRYSESSAAVTSHSPILAWPPTACRFTDPKAIVPQ